MYPYNLGWKANLAEVFTWTGYPKSDGVVWNVRDECNQFTLTVSTNIGRDLMNLLQLRTWNGLSYM